MHGGQRDDLGRLKLGERDVIAEHKAPHAHAMKLKLQRINIRRAGKDCGER
jgi:hypothetical protein